MDYNKAILLGTAIDINSRITPAGKKVTDFVVVTNEVWNKDGKKVEKYEYHNVACFGKLAELVIKHVSNGEKIFVEGKLQTRSWDKDGVKLSKTEIVADNITFFKNHEHSTTPTTSS